MNTESSYELTKKRALLKSVLDTELKQYLEQLETIDKVILATAEKQLGSSFDISKSIGFLEWQKKNMC